jgi:hypothetical protein
MRMGYEWLDNRTGIQFCNESLCGTIGKEIVRAGSTGLVFNIPQSFTLLLLTTTRTDTSKALAGSPVQEEDKFVYRSGYANHERASHACLLHMSSVKLPSQQALSTHHHKTRSSTTPPPPSHLHQTPQHGFRKL